MNADHDARPLSEGPVATCRSLASRQRCAAIILAHDAIIGGSSLTIAYLLRVGWPAAEAQQFVLVVGPLTFALLTALVFSALNIQQRVWRHVSIGDVVALGKASVVVIVAGVVVTMFIDRLAHLPRSVPLIQWPVFLLLLFGGRVAWRLSSERRNRLGAGGASTRQVLVVGTGTGCAMLLRGVANGRPATLRPVAILDAADRDVGRFIHGVPVLGRVDDLAAVVSRLALRQQRPEQVVVTEPLPPPVLMRLVKAAEAQGMATVKLPGPDELRAAVGEGRVPVEPIPLQCLLGRPQVRLDHGAIDALVAGRRVLVTGAGGSIGQELVRLLAAAGPARLGLVDSCEYNLYAIDLDLAERFPTIGRTAWLADIRLPHRVRQVFDAERPELVFHAAALKHVPMVELNPSEGVVSNVVGSRNVADAALRAGVQAMVQVSTDKAVNPTNVMGATKRLAELYCQAMDLEAAAATGPGQRVPRFMTVRFGNVLGSSGSVVPRFQRQIDEGGPVTVTDPEIRRFFMTIREACELVLQASAHGLRDGAGRGVIFVLDMGEAVRVIDIARQMIRLSGKEPDHDIKIDIVGLRPGEKLFEELFDSNELRLPGPADGVLAASSTPRSLTALQAIIDDLERLAVAGDEAALRAALADAVPGFDTSNDDHNKQNVRAAA